MRENLVPIAVTAALAIIFVFHGEERYRDGKRDAQIVRVIYSGEPLECSYVGKRPLATIIVSVDGRVELSDGIGSVSFAPLSTPQRMADAINQLPDWRCKVKP